MVPAKHWRTQVNGRNALFGLINFDITLHRMDQSLSCIARRNCLLRYLPQRKDGVLVVLRLNHDVRALVDLSRSVRSQQHQFKAVWNLVDAVLDGHARHGMALLAKMQFGEGIVPRPSHSFKAPGWRAAAPRPIRWRGPAS